MFCRKQGDITYVRVRVRVRVRTIFLSDDPGIWVRVRVRFPQGVLDGLVA